MNIKNLVRKNIEDLIPYSSARDEFNKSDNYIYLDANESSYDNGYNRYPNNKHPKLITLISNYKKLNKDELVLCNGTDELIDLVIRVFCEPGKDNIITLTPAYGMYEVSAKINNVNTVKVDLDHNFQIDIEKVKSQFDDLTKIIFITNPNNPTGNCFNEDSIIEIIESFKGIVFIDEAYIDYSNNSLISKVNTYQNLIISQTFSKALGLAGIRLGVGYSNSNLISYLKKVKPPYNVNSLTEKKAIENISSTYIDKSQIKETILERNKLKKKLENFPFVKYVYPSDSNFLLVKVANANKVYKYLLDNGIVVRNRSQIKGCEECLRITVGTPKQNNLLINVLKQI
jgi:histidinol-phosphate aminotransferase